jgi:hypothetical protein
MYPRAPPVHVSRYERVATVEDFYSEGANARLN